MSPPGAGNDPSWLHVVPVCASTNDRLRDELDEFGHGDCLWTENQTAGRGQHGRSWLSPPGVLTASFLLRLPGSRGGLASLVAGLAVARAVERLVPDAQVSLKWPNDVYCRNRKLGGILCEARKRGANQWCIVGIGLNLAPRWRHDAAENEVLAELPTPPIGLDAVTDGVPEPREMLAELRAQLLACWDELEGPAAAALLDEIRARDWLIARRLEIVEPDGGRGRATGIADDGHLLLELDGGGIVPVAGGRVHLLDDVAGS